VKSGGQKKTLRMKVPPSFGFFHAFQSRADANRGKAEIIIKSAENPFDSRGKAMAEKKARELYALALEDARIARIFNPASVRNNIIIAEALHVLDRPSESLPHFGMAILLASDGKQKADLYYARGRCHMLIKNYPEAANDIGKSISMGGRIEKSIKLVYLASAHAFAGRLDEAVSTLRKAFSMKLSNPKSELASGAINPLMSVLGHLRQAGRQQEMDQLIGLWAAWRQL
jgi:tetratricopeptide (TPR) repeat protein